MLCIQMLSTVPRDPAAGPVVSVVIILEALPVYCSPTTSDSDPGEGSQVETADKRMTLWTQKGGAARGSLRQQVMGLVAVL